MKDVAAPRVHVRLLAQYFAMLGELAGV